MAHKRAAVGFHSIPASDIIKSKRTKVRDEMEISNDDVFHNMFSRLPANTLMRFRCVSMHFNTLISRFLNKLASHTKIKPKRTKILQISDGLLRNILSRLPPNPLMRFRCVSMHWNSLISDPYFINSRLRPKILLSGPYLYSHLHTLDTKPQYSMVNLPFPIENRRKRRCIIAFGTFNGIIILVRHNYCAMNKLVLYNPLTGATKILPDPPYPCCNHPRIGEVYGFGFGGDDLNIIVGNPDCGCPGHLTSFYYCHVFSFKTGLWTKTYTNLENEGFKNIVGVFLNGFLHWISMYWKQLKIVVLNVKDLHVLRIDGPCQSDRSISYGLGTLQGCLCLIEPIYNGFDVWVMKEQGVSDSWSKEYSFALALEYGYKMLQTICILEDGRIVMMDGVYRIVFCDPSKGAYNVFTNTDKMLIDGIGIEYVESLASPSDFSYGQDSLS